LPETDGSPFVTYKECKANIDHVKDLLHGIEDDVNRNRESNEKIIKILQGNSNGGLIWKVNSLMIRNQWLDKLIGFAASVLGTLITLYLTGVLNL
jgi:hypothetical protein